MRAVISDKFYALFRLMNATLPLAPMFRELGQGCMRVEGYSFFYVHSE